MIVLSLVFVAGVGMVTLCVRQVRTRNWETRRKNALKQLNA